MAVPCEKRLVLADKLNGDETHWASNDGDYAEAVKKSFFDSLLDGFLNGLERGVMVGGCVVGVPGAIVGGLVGGILGGLRALVVKPLAKLKAPKTIKAVLDILNGADA